MGEIERIQRIQAPVIVDPGRVHKADETRDGRGRRPQQETDTIELASEVVEDQTPATPTAPDDEGHLDIAV